VKRALLLVSTAAAVVAAAAPAQAGILRAAPPHVQFGVRDVGTFTLKGTTITNTSDSDVLLIVSGYRMPDNFSFGLLPGSTCPALAPAILAPGESCDAVMGFRPETFWIGLDQTAALLATATDPATGAVLDSVVIEFYGRAR
jgi:hypothetical protein